MLSEIFLQFNLGDQIAIIVASLTAIGLGGSFYVNYRESKRAYIQRFTDIMTNYGIELTRQLEKEADLKPKDRDLYVITYLETLDRIIFLYTKGKLPKDAIEYLHNYFRYGVTLLRWFEANSTNDEVKKSHWKYFKDYLEKNASKPKNEKEIKAYSEKQLPSVMQNKT